MLSPSAGVKYLSRPCSPNSLTATVSVSGYNNVYDVNSELSNNDIQGMLDNAVEGDTFNFVNSKYNNISLIIDKKVNIASTLIVTFLYIFCFKWKS